MKVAKVIAVAVAMSISIPSISQSWCRGRWIGGPRWRMQGRPFWRGPAWRYSTLTQDQLKDIKAQAQKYLKTVKVGIPRLTPWGIYIFPLINSDGTLAGKVRVNGLTGEIISPFGPYWAYVRYQPQSKLIDSEKVAKKVESALRSAKVGNVFQTRWGLTVEIVDKKGNVIGNLFM